MKVIAKFYKSKQNKVPDDSYLIMDQHNQLLLSKGFEIYNWLSMHPAGKVEFEAVDE